MIKAAIQHCTSRSATLLIVQAFELVMCSSVSIPLYLVPSALRLNSLKSLRNYKPRQDGAHRYASLATSKIDSTGQPLRTASSPGSVRIQRAIQPPERFRGLEIWTTVLGKYLPMELRTQDWVDDRTNPDAILPIHTLVPLLQEARRMQPRGLDLLGYLGIFQGRWAAVIWLIKAMVEHMSDNKASQGLLESYHHQSWTSVPSVDDFTGEMVDVEPFIQPFKLDLSLDDLTNPGGSSNLSLHSVVPLARDVLGEVWQSVGSIILEAANCPSEECKEIMSHVHEILAHLHHVDALPHTMYNYLGADSYNVLQRPPTLHLLSSRILTTLTDAAWKAHEREVISEASSVGAKYVYKGYELPGARHKPRIREVGAEVWLELVLWSCINGGWIEEAAWIINEMEICADDKKWSVIEWNALKEAASHNLQGPSVLNLKGPESRLERIAGGIEGYSEDPPFVDMGARTVSSEVIAAIIDGLISVVQAREGSYEHSLNLVLQYIGTCKDVLDRKSRGLNPNSWNSIIVRMTNILASDSNPRPELMEQTLNLVPTYLQERQAINCPPPRSLSPNYIVDESAAGLGLLHRTLEAYSQDGNLQGALRTFRRIQRLVDTNRATSMERFLNDVEQLSPYLGDDVGSVTKEQVLDVPGFYPEIPPFTLAAFLNLLTDSKFFDLGRWLIYANDVDGPAISRELYTSPLLQPALLRFATATADAELAIKVTEKLQPPLSEHLLRTLLHSQIALSKWASVKELLSIITMDNKHSWAASDVTSVAKAILGIESQILQNLTNLESLIRPTEILQSLLEGHYNSPTDPAQPRDLSQTRMLNQISRILGSVDGRLAVISSPFIRESGQEHSTTEIPVDAFNILIGGLVDSYGSIAGKHMWEKWCHEIGEEANAYGPLQEGMEKVVKPNLSTVRVIVHPLLKVEDLDTAAEVKSANAELFNWAVAMYRKFGYADIEISMEIPGYFNRQQRRNWRWRRHKEYTMLAS